MTRFKCSGQCIHQKIYSFSYWNCKTFQMAHYNSRKQISNDFTEAISPQNLLFVWFDAVLFWICTSCVPNIRFTLKWCRQRQYGSEVSWRKIRIKIASFINISFITKMAKSVCLVFCSVVDFFPSSHMQMFLSTVLFIFSNHVFVYVCVMLLGGVFFFPLLKMLINSKSIHILASKHCKYRDLLTHVHKQTQKAINSVNAVYL